VSVASIFVVCSLIDAYVVPAVLSPVCSLLCK
jgi:hypothetical protein